MIVLNNILIGDVWLCSGQSNMVHQMGIHNVSYAEDIAKANFPQIRKSYLLELERNSNYKDVKFEAVDKSLLITSDRFQDTTAMRTLHERLKTQAEKYRFDVMQYFGAPTPFVINLDSFKDDTIVFTP